MRQTVFRLGDSRAEYERRPRDRSLSRSCGRRAWSTATRSAARSTQVTILLTEINLRVARGERVAGDHAHQAHGPRSSPTTSPNTA